MCARFQSVHGNPAPRGLALEWFSPQLSDARLDMFPRYLGAVIRTRDGSPGLDAMIWTLLPFWTRAADWKKFRHNFNARAETLDAVASFRAPLKTRRCLVPAECFTEFPVVDGAKRQHRIHASDQGPLLFAGLWDRWTSPDRSEEILSFTVITAEPHEGLRWLHHRMPVALSSEAQAVWLDPSTRPEHAKALLVSPEPDQLRAVAVDA